MVNELVQDLRVVWDSNRLKEIDEAKALIRKYTQKGYEAVLETGEVMKSFRPHFEAVVIKAKKTGMRVMKILCESGDDRITWNRDNGPEAMEAKVEFKKLLGKGYKAYSVDSDGNKNQKITEFDVDAEEILMIPETAKG